MCVFSISEKGIPFFSFDYDNHYSFITMNNTELLWINFMYWHCRGRWWQGGTSCARIGYDSWSSYSFHWSWCKPNRASSYYLNICLKTDLWLLREFVLKQNKKTKEHGYDETMNKIKSLTKYPWLARVNEWMLWRQRKFHDEENGQISWMFNLFQQF